MWVTLFFSTGFFSIEYTWFEETRAEEDEMEQQTFCHYFEPQKVKPKHKDIHTHTLDTYTKKESIHTQGGDTSHLQTRHPNFLHARHLTLWRVWSHIAFKKFCGITRIDKRRRCGSKVER